MYSFFISWCVHVCKAEMTNSSQRTELGIVSISSGQDVKTKLQLNKQD